MISNAYKQYQQNSIMTASKETLTLMLYNGAIKFCNQTIEAIGANNIQRAHDCNIKAQNIIIELQETLDRNYIYAKDINRIYDFIRQLLMEGNMSKDSAKIDDAARLIRELRDLWQQVIKKAKKES